MSIYSIALAIDSTPTLQTKTRHHDQPAKRSSPFVELPLEIRRQIYDATLGLSLADQLSLLSTNHQVYNEGYNFVFRRPLIFSSRLRLQSFVNSHSPDVLGQVRSLGLRLRELAPSAMESYLRNVIMGIPVLPSEHPYLLESELILSSLRMMPSLKHFILLPPRQKNLKPAPRELVQYLLTQIPQYWNQLESLSINIDLKSITFLADMPRLRSLQYLGCSDTEAECAKLIMNQMSCLQELAIIGPPTAFLKRQKCSHRKGANMAMTPDVLSSMHPLKRLIIHDLSPPGNPTFFTRQMLTAISQTHGKTLQSFQLSVSSQPDTDGLDLLKYILTNMSTLQDLQLEWPGIGMDTELVSDYLPPTLRHLTLAVQNGIHAQELIDALASDALPLPHLRDVHFNLLEGMEQLARVEGLPVLRASRSHILTGCGTATPSWRMTWGIWRPTGQDDT